MHPLPTSPVVDAGRNGSVDGYGCVRRNQNDVGKLIVVDIEEGLNVRFASGQPRIVRNVDVRNDVNNEFRLVARAEIGVGIVDLAVE